MNKEKVQQLSTATVAFYFKMSSNSELKTDKERSTVRKGNRRKRRNKETSIAAKNRPKISLTGSGFMEDAANDRTKCTMDTGGPKLNEESVFMAMDRSNPKMTPDLNNNEATAQLCLTEECYSLKHKKFRKRSFLSSTSSAGDCCGSVTCTTCDTESAETVGIGGESLKNLPIKKRRKFLENENQWSIE